MSDRHLDPLDSAAVEKMTAEGEALGAMIEIDPAQRDSLDFGGAINIVSIGKEALVYLIHAELPRKLEHCSRCGQATLSRHGRYVIRLADLPYRDSTGRVTPVQYAIKAQRYKCTTCQPGGEVEPLPYELLPALTTARITRRLSLWLMSMMQTNETYDTLSRMTGYSKVWHRKWFMEVRKLTALPPKPNNKPGRRKKS